MKKALELIHERVHQALQKRAPHVVNQSQGSPRLVAVSKYQPLASIKEAYDYGQRYFGENYINELVEKSNSKEILQDCQDIKWHFIGHLQKNKVNKLVKIPNLHIVETVDSKQLAQLINQALERHGKQAATNKESGDQGETDGQDTKLKVMIQVNTSGEEAKSGASPEDLIPLAEFIWNDCKALELCGIMTIGKLGGWPDDGPNRDFLTLFELRDKVCRHLGVEPQFFELSMGMSSDFEEALELGSTNIRVGTMIFGERKTNAKPVSNS